MNLISQTDVIRFVAKDVAGLDKVGGRSVAPRCVAETHTSCGSRRFAARGSERVPCLPVSALLNEQGETGSPPKQCATRTLRWTPSTSCTRRASAEEPSSTPRFLLKRRVFLLLKIVAAGQVGWKLQPLRLEGDAGVRGRWCFGGCVFGVACHVAWLSPPRCTGRHWLQGARRIVSGLLFFADGFAQVAVLWLGAAGCTLSHHPNHRCWRSPSCTTSASTAWPWLSAWFVAGALC